MNKYECYCFNCSGYFKYDNGSYLLSSYGGYSSRSRRWILCPNCKELNEATLKKNIDEKDKKEIDKRFERKIDNYCFICYCDDCSMVFKYDEQEVKHANKFSAKTGLDCYDRENSGTFKAIRCIRCNFPNKHEKSQICVEN